MIPLHGHDVAWGALLRSTAQSFAFVGPEGVGRRTAAVTWAAWLNCSGRDASDPAPCGTCASCVTYAAGTGPDLVVKGPRSTTRSGRAAQRKSVPIDAIVPRTGPTTDPEPLTEWIASRPHGRARVAVIDSADSMSEAAANALLKTLEEPPPWARIVLIAPSTASLLPTIVSRCNVVRFGAAPVERFGHLAPHPALRTGSIGPLMRAEADPEVVTRIRDACTALVEALDGSLDDAWTHAATWAEAREADPPLAEAWLLETVRERDPRRFTGALDAVLEARDAFAAYVTRTVILGNLVLRLRESSR